MQNQQHASSFVFPRTGGVGVNCDRAIGSARFSLTILIMFAVAVTIVVIATMLCGHYWTVQESDRDAYERKNKWIRFGHYASIAFGVLSVCSAVYASYKVSALKTACLSTVVSASGGVSD